MLLCELFDLNERIYSKEGHLVISYQASKETSTDDAISTYFRRNPYQSHLPSAKNVDVYSLLNYVSSQENTNLLKSLKGAGPYDINERQLRNFIDDVVKQAVAIFHKIRPDTVISPKSSSPFLGDFMIELKKAYPKADYVSDAFVKKALDAENIEPILNKDHPDWEKFETEQPKKAAELRRSLANLIRRGENHIEIKKLWKPYAKFIKNFVELQNADHVIDVVIDKKVVVIDDVLSTGATIAEMIRQLKEFEPKSIQGFTIFKRTTVAKESLENCDTII